MGVRAVLLQQRYRLLYVVHPVSVLEQGSQNYSSSSGDIACGIPYTKSLSWKKRQWSFRVEFFSRDIVLYTPSTHVSVLEKGTGIRCFFDPWIQDLGWKKNLDQDPDMG
jgi:hypothetical protein